MKAKAQRRHFAILPDHFSISTTQLRAMRSCVVTVEKLRFSDNLSIETTFSIEFATANRALLAQFSVVLYKNRDTCSRFL